MSSEIASYLQRSSVPPSPGSRRHKEWLGLRDAFDFLGRSTKGNVPVYISGPHFFLYSVFVPSRRFKGNYIEDLLGWNFSVPSGWGHSYYVDPKRFRGPQVTLFDHSGSKILDGGEPFLFLRHFEGYRGFDGRSSYVELAQRIPHLLDLHWVPERRAFSRFNDTGDFVDVISILREENYLLCTIDRDALDLYLYLTKTRLARVFDVTRSHDWVGFSEQGRKTKLYRNRPSELFARHTLAYSRQDQPHAAWLRGFQIIRSVRQYDAETLFQGEGRKKRKYATFIALDWRHKKVRQVSCDPAKLGNYFVPSDLPFETTPAFFRPDALLKYKQDPDKYAVAPRAVRCRAAWSLEYDINSAGQIHAYLVDLARLPYSEQLYWKSFNERPKGGISRRAFVTDFEGRWDESYDPLISLQRTLENFPTATHSGLAAPIWEAEKGVESADRLAYVVTEAPKEWDEHILALAKVLVDGLVEKNIRRLAQHLGCEDPKLASIRLLGKVLEVRGISSGPTGQIVQPLQNLWSLRSKGIAHRGQSRPKGNLKRQYRDLLAACDEAMKVLAALIRAGHLDIK